MHHRTSRFQFRLNYLIYLLTLVALSLAVLRRIFEIRGGWQLNAVFGVYVVVLTAYFAFRFPILVRRIWRGRESLATNRARLERLIESKRQAEE